MVQAETGSEPSTGKHPKERIEARHPSGSFRGFARLGGKIRLGRYSGIAAELVFISRA